MLLRRVGWASLTGWIHTCVQWIQGGVCVRERKTSREGKEKARKKDQEREGSRRGREKKKTKRDEERERKRLREGEKKIKRSRERGRGFQGCWAGKGTELR